ncbi:MAG: PepSY-associated TM helix domain-containing protein [Ferrimonas sp.]
MPRSLIPIARAIHQYVSMAMLLLTLFFAVTGITLNHPEWFIGAPHITENQWQLPESLHQQALVGGSEHSPSVDSEALLAHVRQQHPLAGAAANFELLTDWHGQQLRFGELSLTQQGPGYHATIFIDLVSGEVEVNERDAGVIAMLNDLHKGRHSGAFWSLLIDISALLMVLFVISGLLLVLPNRRLGPKLFKLAGISAVLSVLLMLSTR